MRTIRILLIAGFLFWLALPALQRSLHLLPRVTLGGTQTAVAKPDAALKSWFDGSFQTAYERYYNYRFPLRPLLIKSWNQLYYTLFGVVPPRKGGTRLVVGKDNTLFEEAYLRTYNRNDNRTEDDLRSVCRRVRAFQDALQARHIAFLLVIAPSKVEFYPERVPDERIVPGRAQRRTVYDKMAPLLREAGVNLLDAHDWFLQMKATAPYPLFPKGGTHWNQYGAALVAGRILKEMERQTGRNYPDIVIDRVVTNRKAEGADSDLFALLNLWGGFTFWKRASFAGVEVHPDLRPDPDPTAIKPNLLFVGDSFCLTLTAIMDRLDCYRQRDTYYYFKRAFSYRTPEPGRLIARGREDDGVPLVHETLDVADALEGRDGVVIELNEEWLPKIGFGFIEFVLDHSVKATGVQEDSEEGQP
jgi:hypothetical protein